MKYKFLFIIPILCLISISLYMIINNSHVPLYINMYLCTQFHNQSYCDKTPYTATMLSMYAYLLFEVAMWIFLIIYLKYCYKLTNKLDADKSDSSLDFIFIVISIVTLPLFIIGPIYTIYKTHLSLYNKIIEVPVFFAILGVITNIGMILYLVIYITYRLYQVLHKK